MVAIKSETFQSGSAASSNPEKTKLSDGFNKAFAFVMNVEAKPLSRFQLVRRFGSLKAILASEGRVAAELLWRYRSTKKINTRRNVPMAKGKYRWFRKAIGLQNPQVLSRSDVPDARKSLKCRSEP